MPPHSCADPPRDRTSGALSTLKHKTVDPVSGAVSGAASAVSHSAQHTKDAISSKGKDHHTMNCHVP